MFFARKRTQILNISGYYTFIFSPVFIFPGERIFLTYLILSQGFAIGNGLTNPAIQYAAYPDYALEMGLIKQIQYNIISKFIPACEWGIKRCGKNFSPILKMYV